jgi:ADP-heptose:LPS heptosyltransferase
MRATLKILAIQFKSLGDAVLLVPALHGIRAHYPGCELHVLVSQAAAPLLQHQPGLAKVWAMPRVHGRALFKQNWSIVRALRAERFDRSVDFGSNDRSAIVSRLCGARERLGVDNSGGFLGRRYCYTRRVPVAPLDRHESLRSFHVLSAWGITPPASMEIRLRPDPALAGVASELLPGNPVVCHLGAGISKKEWPVSHWAALYRLATGAGYGMVFSAGAGSREEKLALELKQLVPEAPVLPALDLARFLAVLQRARAVVSNDTGPMHFAACLGVPTLGLFGPTSPIQWAPLGPKQQVLCATGCVCEPTSHICHSAKHCMLSILPEEVLRRLQELSPQLRPGNITTRK